MGSPMGVQLPPVTYNPPVDMGMHGGVLPQQIPAQFNGDVPHPEVIAEEQRRNLAQARQNLELKIKELTEQSEKHKKSIEDQANQQIREYAKRLEEQVKQTGSQVDAQLKAD